jgi:hypothetical protein
LKRFCAILVLTLSVTSLNAQLNSPQSNLRKKVVEVNSSKIILDTLSIVPNTLTIPGISPDNYQIDYVNAVLTWLAKPPVNTVAISYRVFPYKLNSTSRRFNYDSIRYNFTLEPFVFNRNAQQSSKLVNFGTLNYNGSFGRGISFGNNQDAVVSSTMNLQLNGFIGDSLELTAAITDNSLPIQPEGNTQDLRDFDRVLVQVKKRGWQLTLGDIDIRQTSDYFLNFYKRLQGASYHTDNKINKNTKNSLTLSGAIAKGKFARHEIIPLEGNQGPYRLINPNNELYFIVLANTERIFINGELLTRGEDQDYVINYNTAEVSFTPKRLITKDLRILVEFEYADRNFLNSQLYLRNETSYSNKLRITVGAFSNTDAKNSSINQELDARQKQFLASIGDKLDSARFRNAVRDTFASNKILYKRVDTSFNGTRDSIYIYSTNPNDTLYSLSFLYVGPGKGNYTPLTGNVNGRAFQWLQPDANGLSRGDWEPVILLITPKKQQLFTLGAEYIFSEKTKLRSEIAMSNYDVNTFSAKDKGNDEGFAAKLQFQHQQRILKSIAKDLSLRTAVDYEFVHERFRPLERLRNIEFNRDWSLPYDAPAATENLVTTSLLVSDLASNMIGYDLTVYNRSDNYRGFRHAVRNNLQLKTWRIAGLLLYTHINNSIQNGTYVRPNIEISKRMPALKDMQIGVSFLGESNKQLSKIGDTLNPFSFSFNTWQMFVKSADNRLNKWSLTYFTREDKFPIKQRLVTSDRSRNIAFATELLKNERHQFKTNIIYRKLDITNSNISKQRADESLLGRAEYSVNEWKGFVVGSMLYELGAGQEQKREFTFIEVPAGQGEYYWIDYNNNNIPELNEFEIGVFQDQKRYIRVFTPTNEYVKANYVQFNYTIDLNPRVLMPAGKLAGMRSFISRITTNSSLQISRKDISTGKFQLNPFSKQLVDTTLITLSSFLSNTVFFNRTNVKWGTDVTHKLTSSKTLLTYGFESRRVMDLNLRLRWNVSKSISMNIATKRSENDLFTPKFSNRNYQIREVSVEPTISYIYGSKMRLSLIYDFERKENQLMFHERSSNHAMSAEARYNVLANSVINAKYTLERITFSSQPGGTPGSTVGYVLLDGLLPGTNHLWNLDLTKRLARNIELNLQYEGRKPAGTRSIHTGRAALRAIF